MTELKKFEYFFLRYSPYPMMDDYVTFGVIMLEAGRNGFAGAHFMEDYRRLRCSFPNIDSDYLDFLKQDIDEQLAHGTKGEELIAKMFDCFGNSVQVSPYHHCLAEDGQAALKLLANNAIDFAVPPAEPSTPSRRKSIVNKIQDAFVSVGIWSMVHKRVPVAEYTNAGDPLKIDVVYQPNGVVKMLQAISLKNSISDAKELSFTYPELEIGVAQKKKATTALTAIIEDDLDRKDPKVLYGIGIMERSGIDVAIAAELPLIAKKAKMEFGL